MAKWELMFDAYCEEEDGTQIVVTATRAGDIVHLSPSKGFSSKCPDGAISEDQVRFWIEQTYEVTVKKVLYRAEIAARSIANRDQSAASSARTEHVPDVDGGTNKP